MSSIRVSHVVGLVHVEEVQPGWLIKRRDQWCEVARVERRIDGVFSWAVYVREYVKPVRHVTRALVEVTAPVEAAQPLAIEPYGDGRNDGKLYLTREQAGLLANLHRTYLPPAFESTKTEVFLDALNGALTRFAEGK